MALDLVIGLAAGSAPGRLKYVNYASGNIPAKPALDNCRARRRHVRDDRRSALSYDQRILKALMAKGPRLFCLINQAIDCLSRRFAPSRTWLALILCTHLRAGKYIRTQLGLGGS